MSWIPCSERLPEERKPVLINPAYGCIIVSWFQRGRTGRMGFYGYMGRKVTHWMPLPAPPSAGPVSGEGK